MLKTLKTIRGELTVGSELLPKVLAIKDDVIRNQVHKLFRARLQPRTLRDFCNKPGRKLEESVALLDRIIRDARPPYVTEQRGPDHFVVSLEESHEHTDYVCGTGATFEEALEDFDEEWDILQFNLRGTS
jgi:hypothetical protein